MNKILLISHGTMAKGLYEAANMFVEDLNMVKYHCLPQGKSIVEYKMELLTLLESYGMDDQIFVLADIKGGSPYNCAAELMDQLKMQHRVHIISGMNLPLLIQIIFSEDLKEKEQIDRWIEEGRKGIELFEMVTNNKEEDEDL